MGVPNERRYPEPRVVEVRSRGQWWRGLIYGWRRDADMGWVADVSWYEPHEWGRGQYVSTVPAERVREPTP